MVINESNEPLVDIKKVCTDLIIALDNNRAKKEETAYLRKTVAEMICRAKGYLPNGYTFVIRDAWRPKHVQEEIINSFIKRFTKNQPSWPKEKTLREVEKYVAPANGKNASGHMVGGAVDLTLSKKGRKIPMKSSKLSYQENAKSLQTKLPKYIQRNRQLMFNVLRKVSLSNYPKEYWHWSYGDVWWAKRNNKKVAIYGVMEEPIKD